MSKKIKIYKYIDKYVNVNRKSVTGRRIGYLDVYIFFLCHQLSRSENQNTHLLSVGLVRINQTSQTRYNVITVPGHTIIQLQWYNNAVGDDAK